MVSRILSKLSLLSLVHHDVHKLTLIASLAAILIIILLASLIHI